jgi:hypothetical protein
MALEAIVFQDGDSQNLVVQTNRGNTGTLEGVVTEPLSNSGAEVTETKLQGGAGETTYTFS